MNKLILTIVVVLLFSLLNANSLDSFYSFDDFTPICKTARTRKLNEGCETNPDELNYTSTCQVSGLFCNGTGTDRKCTKMTEFGKSCEINTDCGPYTCIAKKCGVKLGFGEKCEHNDQCFTERCIGGKCEANITDQECATSDDCKYFNLEKYFCHADNHTCEQYLKEGETCDSKLLCDPSLRCDGVCKQYQKVGAECSVTNPCESNLYCFEDKCIATYSIDKDKNCPTGIYCKVGLACNESKCVDEKNVECQTNDATAAKCSGFCSCPNGVEKKGVCATNPAVKCEADITAYDKCLSTNCNFGSRGSTHMYGDGYCGKEKCAKERSAKFCCLKKEISDWVPYPGFQDSECDVPKPSPVPSAANSIKVTLAILVASFLALLA